MEVFRGSDMAEKCERSIIATCRKLFLGMERAKMKILVSYVDTSKVLDCCQVHLNTEDEGGKKGTKQAQNSNLSGSM